MKLAIICEMPKTRIDKTDVSLDAHTPEDLSACAEKSAKDAFVYCQGPFSEMEFRRGGGGATLADWVLFMAHDCLVDIQAFEAFGEADRSSGEVRFQKWTPSGPLSFPEFPFSMYRFMIMDHAARSSMRAGMAGSRILIEPEMVDSKGATK